MEEADGFRLSTDGSRRKKIQKEQHSDDEGSPMSKPSTLVKRHRNLYMDFTKLRFFNPSIRGNTLLPNEVDVLVSHLLENYPGPRSKAPGHHYQTVSRPPIVDGDGKFLNVDDSPSSISTTIRGGSATTSAVVSHRWRTEEERDVMRSTWLSRKALLWLLIERATVQTYERQAPRRCPIPDEKDWLYRKVSAAAVYW